MLWGVEKEWGALTRFICAFLLTHLPRGRRKLMTEGRDGVVSVLKRLDTFPIDRIAFDATGAVSQCATACVANSLSATKPMLFDGGRGVREQGGRQRDAWFNLHGDKTTGVQRYQPTEHAVCKGPHSLGSLWFRFGSPTERCASHPRSNPRCETNGPKHC